jgi:outer membrane receptor protein involved in Fe transport
MTEVDILWIPDYIRKDKYQRTSFYVQDTASFGRLTINLGLRYDIQKGSWPANTAPGLTHADTTTPILTEYLPAINAPAGEADVDWKTFSPRLSITYDINGDAKNVLKLSLARYVLMPVPSLVVTRIPCPSDGYMPS